jgi:3-hydroxybutyryl-CoA dehydrogenase
LNERLAIAGSGAIACGLAATAAGHGPVTLLVRSPDAAVRARATVDRVCGRLGDEVNAADVHVVTEPVALADATFVVESVIENHAVKAGLLAELDAALGPDAVLATTTSSLSIEQLADASGRPERFAGIHVFHPVAKMKLVELAFPTTASEDTRARARALCEALGKTAVEVPDVPGFVVNRLLFPYLFSAVRLLEETGMDAADVDTCMQLGTGHPMGPLALLDLIGLDVAEAIGETIGEPVPPRIIELIVHGWLGRKSGRGFYSYESR